jgi:hypothetical protein
MTLNDFYNEVARLTDTEKTQINAAETKRVLAIAFQVLAQKSAVEASDLIAKGLSAAAKKVK